MALHVALVTFNAALRTKPLERKPAPNKAQWSAAVVTALHHDLHRSFKRVTFVVRWRSDLNCQRARLYDDIGVHATAIERKP